jgi:hypothetical protein
MAAITKNRNFFKWSKKKIDEKRAITPRWVIKYTSKLQGR